MDGSRERWAELTLHPVRIRVMRAVAGSRRTTRDLAALLPDVPQATLYRHLAVLVGGGVLDVVEEHKVRGAVERVYALAASGAALDAEAMASATPADHDHYFTAFVSSLLSEFSRYLTREHIDLAADGVGYQQLVLHLDDDEMARFATDLGAVLRPLLANQAGGGRVARLFATVMMPTEPPPATQQPEPDPASTTGRK